MNRLRPAPIRFLLAILLLMCCRRTWAQESFVTDGDSTGDAVQAQAVMELDPPPTDQKFVPPAEGDLRSFAGGTLTLRTDATISGGPVKVKNICRWAAADASMFASVADLTITRISQGGSSTRVTMAQVRDTLREAGMNLALISFSGATVCAVARADEQTEERDALEDWIKSAAPPPAAPTAVPLPTAAQAAPDGKPMQSLRDILTADLCARLNIDPADIEMSFNSTDDKVLNLLEPYFQFQITPRHVNGLGDVEWDVVIVSNGEQHKATIAATARAWETQVLLTAPLDYRQVIREEDVEERRTLAQQLPDVPLLTKTQAVGQAASRVLKPGAVLTADMVDPVMLAKPGQIITVSVIHGSIRITAVAKAVDGGSLGQTIRARSDVDPTQVFEVTLTGPQQGTVTNVPTANY
jgi:flagella basal body P-ring formation protein FlgA